MHRTATEGRGGPVLVSVALGGGSDGSPDDVDFMHNALQVNLQTLSSWDVYKTELDSGKLEWSPSHKSDLFWKNNYSAFETQDFAACKKLVSLLSSELEILKNNSAKHLH